MDSHTLAKQFRHVVSLASLAFIFSSIHAIQYSLLDSDYDTSMENTENPTSSQDNASTVHSNLTSTPSHNTSNSNPADTSSSSAKGRWSDQEINQLLSYVEANCPLNTSWGINLKKTHFNQAHVSIKTKDASQCEYKWGNVRLFIIHNGHSLFNIKKALQDIQVHFSLG